jgi:hypothetical protein
MNYFGLAYDVGENAAYIFSIKPTSFGFSIRNCELVLLIFRKRNCGKLGLYKLRFKFGKPDSTGL